MQRDEAASGRLTETAEHYLEAIYYIAHEGEVPRPGGLVEWLGVSPPTVTVTLQRLARDGWVAAAGDHSITLTPSGEAAAALVVRRHRLLERWLVDILGLDWVAADQEASRLAHGMSEAVVDRLDEHLAHPLSCPHGNPIPGRAEIPSGLVRLDLLPPGEPAVVVRISEVAEHEAPQLLRALHDLGVTPGRRVELRPPGRAASAGRSESSAASRAGATAATPGPLLLDVEGQAVEVDRGAARAVWVVRAR
jgi:DtxR family transcriptional regulator, iron-dependent repressor